MARNTHSAEGLLGSILERLDILEGNRGLGGSGVGRQVEDWDEITAPGAYWGFTTAMNGPHASIAYHAIVTGDAAERLYVRAWDPADTAVEWRRTFDGTSWGAWVMVLGDTDWIAPTMQNSFTSRPDAPVLYRRLNGVTYLTGQAYRSSAPGSGVVAFTLPTGFWPKDGLWFSTIPNAVGGDSGHCSIFANAGSGAVSVIAPNVRTGSGTGYPFTASWPSFQ